MRTKALLLAAAVTVAASATSMAQVYSANAVGYVNITLVKGFHILSNPLDGSPDNAVRTILPFTGDAFDGVTLYKFDAEQNNYTEIISYLSIFGGWQGDMDLNPGEGFFIDVPETVAPLNLTFVGEVMQGTLSMDLRGDGAFNLVGSQVPQALPLGPADPPGTPTLEFPTASGDTVYFYDSVEGYNRIYSYVPDFGGWLGTPDPSGPVIQVAEGFFVQKAGELSQTWSRDFSVN